MHILLIVTTKSEMEHKGLYSKWINIMPMNSSVLLTDTTYVYPPHKHTSVKLNMLLHTCVVSNQLLQLGDSHQDLRQMQFPAV